MGMRILRLPIWRQHPKVNYFGGIIHLHNITYTQTVITNNGSRI